MMSVSNLRLVYGDVAEEMIRKDQPVQKIGNQIVCYCADERTKGMKKTTAKCKDKLSPAQAMLATC